MANLTIVGLNLCPYPKSWVSAGTYPAVMHLEGQDGFALGRLFKKIIIDSLIRVRGYRATESQFSISDEVYRSRLSAFATHLDRNLHHLCRNPKSLDAMQRVDQLFEQYGQTLRTENPHLRDLQKQVLEPLKEKIAAVRLDICIKNKIREALSPFLYTAKELEEAIDEDILRWNASPAVSLGSRRQIDSSALSKCIESWGTLQMIKHPVIFENAGAKIELSGTLTLPRSVGPFPAVIFLHGSGDMGRNYPLVEWGDYLTTQGIAVLRYDKRGVGGSEGDLHESTIQDFSQDALAAVEFLKARPEINPQQIGLIGHNEGGATATLTAVKSEDVAFVILMAAPVQTSDEIILSQSESHLKLDGIDEESMARMLNFRKKIFEYLRTHAPEKAQHQLLNQFGAYYSDLPQYERQLEKYYYPLAFEQVKEFTSRWFRHRLTYDIVSDLKKIKVPVLALNGALDLVVSAEQNLRKIDEAFKEAKHQDYTSILFPGINHAFRECKTGHFREQNKSQETSSLVLKTMSDWIKDKTKLGEITDDE